MTENDITNLEMLAASLCGAVNGFVKELKRLKPEILELQRQVELERSVAAREIEALDAQIKAKQQQHSQIEASIKSLQDGKAAILKQLDVRMEMTQ